VKIRELHVDRFGRWTGLSVRGLSEGLNVFLGANESGKTTLLHFIRAVLYGFSSERRQRFLARHDVGAGGQIVIAAKGVRHTMSRHDAEAAAGRLHVTDADGAALDDTAAQGFPSVDESVFQNVFAVGLREMQELSTLSDGEVAARLYDLAAGLDRVSLGEALREVRETRRSLLSDTGEPSLIAELVKRRRSLHAQLEQNTSVNRRYAQLAGQRRDLDAEVQRAEQTLGELQSRLQAAEAAIAVREPWGRRSEVRARLAELGDPAAISEEMVRRLELCKDRIRRHRAKIRTLRQRRAKLRPVLAKLNVNEAWMRHAPSLVALADQREWIGAVEKRAADLQDEVTALRRQIAAEEKRLGIAPPTAPAREEKIDYDPAAHYVPRDALRELRSLDESLRTAARRHERLHQQAIKMESVAAQALDQAEPRSHRAVADDLSAEWQRLDDEVQLLRRCVELDDQIGQLEQALAEPGRPDLPLEVPELSAKSLIGLGVFVVSVPMLFAGLLFGGGWGWTLGLLGLAGLGAGGYWEYRSKRGSVPAVLPVEPDEGQLNELRQQLEEALQEHQELAEQLPPSDLPPAERLPEAERQMTELEELLTAGESSPAADVEVETAQEQARAARAEADDAAAELRDAEVAWAAALEQAGLPGDIEIGQLREALEVREPPKAHPAREMREDSEHLIELRHRFQRCERELQDTERTQQEFLARIERLFQELDLPRPEGTASAQLQELRHELLRHEETWRGRERLLAQSRHLWERIANVSRSGKRWSRRRRMLLRKAGAADETEFFRRAQQFGHFRESRSQLEGLDREIAAHLGAVPQQQVAALLEGPDLPKLPDICRDLQAQLQRTQRDLAARHERRGELEGELKQLAKDRSLAEIQLEIGAVEQQLSDATRQWQVLAAAGCILDTVRERYETHRQPEVLQDASRYLSALTEGKYVRVWTPLGEELLRVSTAGGATFDVQLLSRGTREQLFLALRLALAKSYARRGIELPLVLDDVLVNFDTRRSRAAAKLLCEFAQEGQQLLVFTCHEHIAEMFRALDAPVHALPEQGEEMILNVRVDGAHEPRGVNDAVPARHAPI
jgi:uncharacterized protein YhaN